MLRLHTAALVAAVLATACAEEGGGEGGAGSTVAPASVGTFPSTGSSAICGDEEHVPLTQPPLVYFVLDLSGSMSEPVGNGTRYSLVRDGAGQMVDQLGALVRVGAAAYPFGATEEDPCPPGDEVFAPRQGGSGVAADFVEAIDFAPFGGTPTAATLGAVRGLVEGEAGTRAVLLATDGGPNCNFGTSCEAAQCIPNIEGFCPPEIPNCCVDPGTPANCLDRAATLLAVSELAEAGVLVYVIGIPGSEIYGDLLDQMAIVGGGAQVDAPTFYYRVDDLSALGSVFGGIAAALVSCTYDLSDPPAEQGLTNVYFDGAVVVSDPVDGWVWVDADTIELVGAACAELRTGSVSRVQIVSGCPTEIPL